MVLNRPIFTEPANYTATELRQFVDTLFSTDGVIRTGDCLVSQRSAGANMTVDVAAGAVALTGNSVANQGTYVATSTAVVNCAVTANASGSTRTDLLVAQISDTEADSSGLQSWTPLVVTNPSVGTGTPPTTPTDSLPLAIITVPTGATSIVTANITDVRTQACAVGTPFIQKGVFNMTFVAGVASATVTFPRAFPGAPTVILSCSPITGNTATVVNLTGASATSFSYRAAPAAGGSIAGVWAGQYVALY